MLERILDNEPDNTPANEVNFRSLVMQPYCQAATREDVPALLRYLGAKRARERTQTGSWKHWPA